MADTPAPLPQSDPERPSLSRPYEAPGLPNSKKGNGSGWILALAIMQFLGGLILWAMSDTVGAVSVVSLVILMLLAAAFFGLWLWGRKSPFPALLTALILFVSMHLLDAVFDPATLLRGFLVKIVMLVGLSVALKQAYMQKRQRELEGAATAEVPPLP